MCIFFLSSPGGRDCVVDVTTRYGLDGPGIESRWKRDLSCRPDRLEAHPASCTMRTGSFPRVQRQERGAAHPPPSSAGLRMGWSRTSASPLCLHRNVTD